MKDSFFISGRKQVLLEFNSSIDDIISKKIGVEVHNFLGGKIEVQDKNKTLSFEKINIKNVTLKELSNRCKEIKEKVWN